MIQGYMILWLREGLKEQHLLELEIFCNNAKVFTVTFDQFNPSLLNKTFKAYYPQTFQWYIFCNHKTCHIELQCSSLIQDFLYDIMFL